MLQYGCEVRQGARTDKETGIFSWNARSNSIVVQTGLNKDLLQHFFTIPIKHKHASFSSSITSLTVSDRSYE